MGRKKLKIKKSCLYCYVSRENRKWARTMGKKQAGSHSAYVDNLITVDKLRMGKLKGAWAEE